MIARTAAMGVNAQQRSSCRILGDYRRRTPHSEETGLAASTTRKQQPCRRQKESGPTKAKYMSNRVHHQRGEGKAGIG